MSCRLARGGLSFTSVVVDSNCSVEVIVGDVDDVGVVGGADDAGVLASWPLWWTRWFEVMERGRFRPSGPARIEASRGRAPVMSRHAHVGERFSDAVGPTFMAASCAPLFLTIWQPKIWDFTPLPSSSALASCFFRSLTPTVPPPLSLELRSKARHHHVNLMCSNVACSMLHHLVEAG
jgi:hypothetical protein